MGHSSPTVPYISNKQAVKYLAPLKFQEDTAFWVEDEFSKDFLPLTQFSPEDAHLLPDDDPSWSLQLPTSPSSGSATYASSPASPPTSPSRSHRFFTGERTLPKNNLLKPLVALALPGMYLMYRYNQYRRQQQEANKRKAAERELGHLNHKIDKLLCKLDEHEPELATTQEEECVICVHAKATMQTFPCGHKVVCRKCFVKTIQVAVKQRLLPLRCVVCRAKILRLRQSRDPPFPSSISQYSVGSYESSRNVHNSNSLSSFNSSSSGFSEGSYVSSASSSSGGGYYRGYGRNTKPYRTAPHPPVIKRAKVSSKSGARSKESMQQVVPKIQIENYEIIPIRVPTMPRPSRATIRENKVAPQDISGRLPTIAEYNEIRTDKEIELERSSSTRIRCAQKLVSQLEGRNRRSNLNVPIILHIIPPSGGGQLKERGHSPNGPRSSKSSPVVVNYGKPKNADPKTSVKNVNDVPNSTGTRVKRRDSSYSGTSVRSSASALSTVSQRSDRSCGSGKSVASSQKSTASSKSSASSVSTASTVTVKSCRYVGSSKSKEGGQKDDVKDLKPTEQNGKVSKEELANKMQKKKVDGKEYHRLH